MEDNVKLNFKTTIENQSLQTLKVFELADGEWLCLQISSGIFVLRCEEWMRFLLFDLECEEAVDDQDDTLDESQSSLGHTEVSVAGVELPAGEVVVGEPRGEDVQDGSGHTEEQVLKHTERLGTEQHGGSFNI